ncbi:MAG: pectate lyase [Polyangiaceae bacterium]
MVPPCAVYDGKGERLTAQGMGDGSQNEGQKPLFILTPGAGIKNVKIAAPGCEGIHMMGNNTVDSITWEDVGEDAASVRSYFPGGKISITNGSAKSAADKTFQFNAPCDVTIKNFTANDIGKLARQNGGKDFPLTITLDTVTANNVKDAVVMSDSPQCIVRYHALTTDISKPFVGPMKVSTF